MIILGFLNIALGMISYAVFFNMGIQKIAYSSDILKRVYLSKGKHNMYIEIDGFFQNNLKYTKSINYDQLNGRTERLNLKDCKPYDYKDGKPYYPAGLVANTYFQDIIRIEGLDIQTMGISWGSEKNIVNKTAYTSGMIIRPQSWASTTNEDTVPLNTTPKSGLPILNERFVNWIHLSTFSRFRKLWGIVNVKEGCHYLMEVESIFDFSKKSICFTKGSWLGFKNYFVTAGLIAAGVFSISVALFLKRSH